MALRQQSMAPPPGIVANDPLHSAHRVDPSHVSTWGILSKQYQRRQLPHWATLGPYKLISPQVQNEIERADPGGGHQMLPFELRFRDGEVVTGYAILNICQMFDFIDVEKSRLEAHLTEQGTTYYSLGPASKLMLRRAAFGIANLWLDSRFGYTFLSNELAATLKPLMINAWLFEPIEEV